MRLMARGYQLLWMEEPVFARSEDKSVQKKCEFF
jgi:hypothetical protein